MHFLEGSHLHIQKDLQYDLNWPYIGTRDVDCICIQCNASMHNDYTCTLITKDFRDDFKLARWFFNEKLVFVNLIRMMHLLAWVLNTSWMQTKVTFESTLIKCTMCIWQQHLASITCCDMIIKLLVWKLNN